MFDLVPCLLIISNTARVMIDARVVRSPHLASASAAEVSAQFNVGVVQMAMTDSPENNADNAERLVREAVAQGANVVILPELFEHRYFPKAQLDANLELARDVDDCALLQRFAKLSEELSIVLPVSFYEKAGQARFNSCAVYENGTRLGVYRKSHIPDGPGYQEKFHFSPGDTGGIVFATRFGALGVGICWDQWFPEYARVLCLLGADLLVYPTAIGSEPPPAAPLDSRGHWRRVMQGHAGANLTPVVAANRVGAEPIPGGADGDVLTFYGSSFIADVDGALLADMNDTEEGVRVVRVDRVANDRRRSAWGVFRDRRPDVYGAIGTMDGTSRSK